MRRTAGSRRVSRVGTIWLMKRTIAITTLIAAAILSVAGLWIAARQDAVKPSADGLRLENAAVFIQKVCDPTEGAGAATVQKLEAAESALTTIDVIYKRWGSTPLRGSTDAPSAVSPRETLEDVVVVTTRGGRCQHVAERARAVLSRPSTH
jgi:hypothetical protein